jgi:hypothetical protein
VNGQQEGLRRHPEWKHLYDEIATLLEPGQLWTYAQLTEIAAVDIRSTRGRQQFFRCRDEILKKHGWWMENVRDEGYRVIHPNDQPTSALRRMKQGHRRIRVGGRINALARIEFMTAEIARASADMQVRIAALELQVRNSIQEQHRQLGAAEPKRLPHPMRDFNSGIKPQ